MTTDTIDPTQKTTDPADLQLEIQDLGAVYLGGFTFASLGRADRAVECTPGARDRADALFATTVVPGPNAVPDKETPEGAVRSVLPSWLVAQPRRSRFRGPFGTTRQYRLADSRRNTTYPRTTARSGPLSTTHPKN